MSEDHIRISRTAAEMDDDTPFEDWLSKAKSFISASLSSQWWIGDLLNIGEAKFGEQYTQIVNDLGVEYKTLQNYKWVSKSVAPEIRRAELTWQHHVFVSKLTPKEQATWLQRAVSKGMSTGDLRAAIKTKMAHDAEKRHADEDANGSDDDGGKKRYRVILVIPDWKEVSVEHLSDIRLPADQESCCVLVVPASKVREGVLLFESWNFVCANTAVLVHPKAFDKEWFRTSHEIVMVGVRGEMKSPPTEKMVSSVITCGAKGTEVLYDIVELMFPAKNKKKTVRCDLFGKEPREGWDCLAIPEPEPVEA